MSLTDISKMYENMLREPENRKSSSGQIRQPSPYDSGKMADPSETGEEPSPVNAEENAYLASIDQRMAARKSGNPITESSETSGDVSRLVKLEKEVSELQELMTEMMKTHIKLLGKLK